MKSQLISSMASFVLGTGVTLASLLTWTGASSLDDIRVSIQNYISESEQHSSALVEDYQVTVENANAEIGEYKVALQQANDNISQLITAYEDKVDEMEQAQQKAQDDLSDLQSELNMLYVKMNSQYEQDMNEVIEQANAEIDKANQEVQLAKEDVEFYISTSQVDEIVQNAEQLKDQLDTGNDKSVQDISSIVPSEQPQE